MTDNDLDNLYKVNVGESHFAGLRGVFDAGYNYALGTSPTVVEQTDPSVNITATQVANEDPNNITTS